MRVSEACKVCGGPAPTYCSIRGQRFVTRYKRCKHCGRTSKTIVITSKPALTTGEQLATMPAAR